MQDNKYSQFEKFNKYISALLKVCKEDPNIHGLMLIGSIGRQEEDQNSDINAEIFVKSAMRNEYSTGHIEIASKIGRKILIFYNKKSLEIVFEDLVELTIKFTSIETAVPKTRYFTGRVLVDKTGKIIEIIQRTMELPGKMTPDEIVNVQAEIRDILLDIYNQGQRQNLWEVKRSLAKIRVIIIRIYAAAKNQPINDLKTFEDVAEEWFVSGLQRCIAPNLKSIPRVIRDALKLLNDVEQNLNLKKSETFPEFDEKLLALIKK